MGREEESVNTVEGARQLVPGVEWYHIDDPESPALDELGRRFNLHPLQIEDCRHRPQRAKAEEHEHYVFVVFKHLHDQTKLNFDDVDAFVGRDFLVTVSCRDPKMLARLRERAQDARHARVDKLFYFLADEIVDGYLPVLDAMADMGGDIESEVLDNPNPEVLSRILKLKRDLIEFRRMSSGMREVINSIIRRENGFIGDDLDPYFRDVYDHLVRTVDLIESYRDLLTGSLDIYMSAVANRTNDVVKLLTVYGTISIPLVVITGFFGMNLHLPWSESPLGAWYASALMLISIAIVLLYFRRKHWI
ncbi:MAG TPA: magnesium/cobalt transporter CorA [Clostridia bacterium]|nr:magnesium/cobalt transporter CorA [Clostridia bacterium]